MYTCASTYINQGLCGSVVGATECFIKVSKPDGEVVRTKVHNIRAAAGSAIPQVATRVAVPRAPDAHTAVQAPASKVGDRVRVVRGTYVRITGQVVSVTARQYTIKADEGCRHAPETPFRVAHSSVLPDAAGTSSNSDADCDDAASVLSNETNDRGGDLGLSGLSLGERPTLQHVSVNSDDWQRVQGTICHWMPCSSHARERNAEAGV